MYKDNFACNIAITGLPDCSVLKYYYFQYRNSGPGYLYNFNTHKNLFLQWEIMYVDMQPLASLLKQVLSLQENGTKINILLDMTTVKIKAKNILHSQQSSHHISSLSIWCVCACAYMYTHVCMHVGVFVCSMCACTYVACACVYYYMY